MARRQPLPRRSADYAWFITGPLAVLAVVWSTVVGIMAADESFGAWPISACLLAVMVASEIPGLHFVIRRQSFTVTLIEVPLVLAFYFLPPLNVVLVATLAALITQLRRRMGAPKVWFNVAKTAAATSLACLVLIALPPMEGVGPATWGSSSPQSAPAL